jgi:hypothetical protein
MNIGRPSSFRNATFESYEIPRNGITRKEAKETGKGVGSYFFWKRNEPTFSSYTNHISQDIIIIYITVANGRIFFNTRRKFHYPLTTLGNGWYFIPYT